MRSVAGDRSRGEEEQPKWHQPKPVRWYAGCGRSLHEKKGEDTKILELDPADSGFTDFFLITSGINEKQTQAISDGIELA